MKRIIYYTLVSLLLLSVVSCQKKKATNVEELKAKYEGKSFTTCDSYFEAYEEIFDVYFATIDKASEGDKTAINELDQFESVLTSLGESTEDLTAKCPEKFEELGKKMEAKMTEYLPKLISIATSNMGDLGIDLNESVLEEEVADIEEIISEEEPAEEVIVEEVTVE